MSDKLAAAEHEANREPETRGEDCPHEWRHSGTAEDGTVFFRCRRCKKEIEE